MLHDVLDHSGPVAQRWIVSLRSCSDVEPWRGPHEPCPDGPHCCLDGTDYVLQNCKVAREVVVLVEICNVALYLNDCTRGLLDVDKVHAQVCCSWRTALMQPC